MPTPAHIGFYRRPDEPLGQFQSLLYVPVAGEPSALLSALQGFFSLPRIRHHPDLSRTVGRLVWYLVQEPHYEQIGIHQSLRPDIGYFYRISLAAGGTLEIFRVAHPLATSPHPRLGSVIWYQAERDPLRWARQCLPPDWQPVLDRPLALDLSPGSARDFAGAGRRAK